MSELHCPVKDCCGQLPVDEWCDRCYQVQATIRKLEADLKHERDNRGLFVASEIADTQDELTIAKAEATTLKVKLEKLNGILRIKSEFLSTRQCPDHSGKWDRGRCLQCEIEELQASVFANREMAATHECIECGAKWIKLREPDAVAGWWTLASKECGPCCDNAAMGDQIKAIGLQAELEAANSEIDRHESAGVDQAGTIVELEDLLQSTLPALQEFAESCGECHGTGLTIMPPANQPCRDCAEWRGLLKRYERAGFVDA